MYKISEFVVYGCGDLYEVKDIGIPDFMEKKEVPYYWLKPVGSDTSMLYIRVDTKSTLRGILSEEKAGELIKEIPEMETIYNQNSKVRYREFLEALKSCECGKWLEMWKGIEAEKRNKLQDGKQLNASDEKSLKKVEECITNELAVVFDITKEEASKWINMELV